MVAPSGSILSGCVGKKKGGARSAISHLSDVFEIVASDAPDAANRKGLCVARDRNRRLWRGRNDKGCGAHGKLSMEAENKATMIAGREGSRRSYAVALIGARAR